MQRIRTIDKAYQEIKAKDPDTGLSLRLVKQLVISGEVPCIMAGCKRLVDVDTLERYIKKVTEGVS